MKTTQSIAGLLMNMLLLTIILFSFTMGASFAQDVITYKNGKEEKAKIMEVTSTEIRFKKSDNPDGPVYSMDKTEIFMVQI